MAVFAECVSALGPLRELPIAVADSDAASEIIPLSYRGLFSDGYDHWLRIQRDSRLIYIAQVGGIIGAQTVFGPFNVKQGCLGFSRRALSPMPADLARQVRGLVWLVNHLRAL